MKGLIYLFVNLAVSSTLCHIENEPPVIVDVVEDKDIPEINKESLKDDILKSAFLKSGRTLVETRWTSPVPYLLNNNLELNARGVILKAMDQFRLKSCIDFKPWKGERNYILFQKLKGCFSYVGRIGAKAQTISIGRFCDDIAVIEHELLHTLGFFHEQSRYDRDSYVTILLKNIRPDFVDNFEMVGRDAGATNKVPYDYWSVMHYDEYAFTTGSGRTIVTKDPRFQHVIGQRLDMSERDVLKLNRHYKCKSTVAFKMYCGFTNGNMCGMNRSRNGTGWRMVTSAPGGPPADHTNLPSGSGDSPTGVGYFMHASTVSGLEGDLSVLESKRMTATRECHVQCLQFYYYHTGNESDLLNIWIREFNHALDSTGTGRLIGQITGERTFHWQLLHVSLNATGDFQVEFEVRKGAGYSSGGFSIDDINLSEIECPHVTMQIDDFETVLQSNIGTFLKSPWQYSKGGYSFLVGITFQRRRFGLFVQLLSGKYDDQLEWPIPRRQVTMQMVDQTPNIQQHMTKQHSITSDLRIRSNGYIWGNPREVGTPFTNGNNETRCAGPLIGKNSFANVDELKSRQFLKGGTAVFVFSFKDLTHLLNASDLPCPGAGPAMIAHSPGHHGPCSTRIKPTNFLPTDDSICLVASPVSLLLITSMLLIP